MAAIRYSHAFKMQAVREVESGRSCAWEVKQKYGVRGSGTVMRWVRQLGSGKHGKVIRVEKPDEINGAARLKAQLRQAKEALADAHMELALERGYLAEACARLELPVEDFKKKLRGGRRTGRSKRTRP
jgi:transposase-like protein